MNKFATIILFLIISSTCFPQQVLQDLSNYKSTKLPNGLTVISVKTNEFKLINYSLIINFHENTDNEYPGAIDMITQLMGCDRTNKTQIHKNMVSDSTAIDSLLNFMRGVVLSPNFEEEKITKTKNFFLKKIEMQKLSRIEFKQIGRRYSFGAKSSFSQFPTEFSINSINKSILGAIHTKIIRPNNTYIIAVGNIEHDTFVKYVAKNFGYWQGENLIEEHETPNYKSETKINFINQQSTPIISINYPLQHYYTDDDFFASEINAKVFENKITETLPKYNYAENIEFKFEPNEISSEFYLLFDTKFEYSYDAIIQSIQTMRDLIIYQATSSDINTAKSDLSTEFKNSTKNPYNIAEYAYITEKNNLPKYYFQKYNENLNKTSQLQIANTTERIFRPDNASILIQGDEKELTCQLYYLAKFFRVEFFDENQFKYKIINKGFDCYTVINDYLDACKASTSIKNLTVKFDATYTADTIYNVEGIIYKKAPNLYYYKTVLIIDEDTLLQKLQIANDEVWLDSSAIGAQYSTEDKFWAKIYQAYIFPELYYKNLSYEPEFICDTSLLNHNIFKIKVNTPYDVFFYDYYDLNKKEKTKTETILVKNGKSETVQIIEYSDYRRISNRSEIKMPYTITQIVGEIFFTLKIKEIDDKNNIKKKIFEFERPVSVDSLP